MKTLNIMHKLHVVSHIEQSTNWTTIILQVNCTTFIFGWAIFFPN